MTFAIIGGGQSDTSNYQIDNSLRFDDDSSSRLVRTPSSTTNRRTWTWSGWIKSTTQSGTKYFWEAQSGTNFNRLGFSNSEIVIGAGTSGVAWTWNLYTSAKHRDPSAWYHVVVAFDTTQSTASNRIKIYVNGNQITDFRVETYPGQNTDWGWNTTGQHNIGARNDSQYGLGGYFDGYMAEINFVDGQALSSTDFGEFDDSGIWKPIEYTGSYGTNGFYLDFEGSGGAYEQDKSGNGNNFVAVGVLQAVDVTTDTPTNNFCTASNLLLYDTAQFAEGNLKITQSSTNADGIRGTIGVRTGKWYWEIYNGGGNSSPGVATESATTKNYIGQDSYGWSYFRDGNKYTNDSASSYGSSFTSGDIIGVALDMDNNQITFYKNNVSQGVAFTGLPDEHMFPGISTSNVVSVTNIANFGQDSSFAGSKTAQNNTDDNGYGDFYYTPPSGFLALCTQNLATVLSPTIDDGSQYFNTILWTGDGSSPRSITGVGFQPDWLWTKARNASFGHNVYDSSRGDNGTGYYRLETQGTDTEIAEPPAGIVTSLDSDGFSVTNGSSSDNIVNNTGTTYVAWNWKANAGTTSSNTNGTINSTVQVNTTAGFSIVTFTTGASTGYTAGHGLNQAPDIIIFKRRNTSASWFTTSVAGLGSGKFVYLDTDSGASSTSVVDPTSTVFGCPNTTNDNYVAYCFHSVEGYSKIGNYTGNGSTNGTFVYTGFRPAFVLWKRTDGATDWRILDTARDSFNVANKRLFPNNTSGDNTAQDTLDFLSNGFKHRATNSGGNTSGGTYLYLAFAENPFVTSSGVPVTAR